MAQTSQSDFRAPLETKYRDIADGNFCSTPKSFTMWAVGNQVPRYSGWKREPARLPMLVVQVGNQVPRYSGWKHILLVDNVLAHLRLETKYRDIADGNWK